MPTPEIVLKLVERFEQNKSAYSNSSYNETQLRREFLDPFFKALGWDIDNTQGWAEAYKEVIHEDAIKIGAATKAPDYCFRIGGVRKFFLEAKKPSINIKDEVSPAFQLRRYAWSAKLPLSILTDFEELAVYDCRVKPSKSDKPSTSRILYLKHTDYDKEWDKISSIFSKDAILKGSFDKYAESAKGKRGTTEVDDVFLKEIESWRNLLAHNIALRNSKLEQRELNFSVQRTIDRIIFLRICEDRGIEIYGSLMQVLNGENVYKRMCQLFHRADEKYNSGLFHFAKEKDRAEAPDELTLGLKIDDQPLKEIIKGLYYPESPYEFSVLPADILGQVYEQFLGKVIRLTSGHHAVVEDKPEVKKAGGVYYTPTYIVDYIVKNTVRKLLEGKTPKKVTKLRILDPACGSGSFLIGAYQYLLDWHRDWYVNDGTPKWSTGKSPTLYQARSNDWKLTTSERKKILLNNIYGVDIDSQAVEVTKLSLLLKVLEGENEQTLATQLRLFHERALPDLGNNIKCGNSLIGPDFYEGKQLSFLDEDERYRINVFDWNAEFSEIMKANGFDAVIGNPPYVRQESLGALKEYFLKYRVYHGVADLYAYFIERAITLLTKGGIFSFIVANKWMRANYGEPLRRWLKQFRIEEIIDFGDLPVFQRVTTYPCILRISQNTSLRNFKATQVTTLEFLDLNQYVKENHFDVVQTKLEDSGWSLTDNKTQALLVKIRSKGVTLTEYINGKIYRGILTGLNEAFVIDEKTKAELISKDQKSKELIKPFLAGRDIKRYQQPISDKFLIFTRHGIDIKEYPAIEKYLSQFKEKLMPKPKNWKGSNWDGRKPGSYKWYEIQDSIDYYLEFEKPKILWPGISAEVTAFALDEARYYGNDNNQLIISDDRYLLGILNSSLARFILSHICDKVQGGFYRLKIIYIEQLPIHQIDFSDSVEKSHHDNIVTLVERMLELHKLLAKAKTDQDKTSLQRQIVTTDKQIDQLVYELYGLTEEEIKTVEGSSKNG